MPRSITNFTITNCYASKHQLTHLADLYDHYVMYTIPSSKIYFIASLAFILLILYDLIFLSEIPTHYQWNVSQGSRL